MNLYSGPYAAELAAASRTVTAAQHAVGQPQLDELDHAWHHLLRVLDRCEVMGEDLRASRAIEHYVADALAAIEGANE